MWVSPLCHAVASYSDVTVARECFAFLRIAIATGSDAESSTCSAKVHLRKASRPSLHS